MIRPARPLTSLLSTALVASLPLVMACDPTGPVEGECPGTAESGLTCDGEQPEDEPEDEEEEPIVIAVTESYESDVGDGWIAAGQPTAARVEDVVTQGGRIISLRYASEETFDEQMLVEGLGGTFIRYQTQGSDYNTVAFREALYDLYDQEHEDGGPVYLHCASGNRVGASWALYQAERKGVPAEDALALGRAAGLGSLESTVRSILGL
jgi:protein tyrosine phosphatase (PTP) superfamily phosphohydrolase (DUF442 family)